MKKVLLISAIVVISAISLSSCTVTYTSSPTANITPNSLNFTREPTQKFYELNYGLETKTIPTTPAIDKSKKIKHLSDKNLFYAPTIQYARIMGLKEKSPKTDYKLNITINRADIDRKDENAWIDLNVSLEDATGKEVYSQVVNTSHKKEFGFVMAGQTIVLDMGISSPLDEAYTKALEQINWDRIASYLKIEEVKSSQKVQGYGDTELEQTIIRWDIQSRPQGADIFWRVVSKTPEVKSTNNKYLMTTPYEATKAIDIKGLTYQTSSNVRIIIRCEKDGYMPQEKEFDVRVILDQEEISAFFRLVKEE